MLPGATIQHVAAYEAPPQIPKMATRHRAIFWIMLGVGFVVMVLLTEITLATQKTWVEYTFIVFGSLYVPVLFVYYLDSRSLFVSPRFRTVLTTFLLGAFVAAPIAAVLEFFISYSGTGSPGPALTTGLIEEFCKASVLLWLLFKGHRYLRFQMDGIILGAAAGMGFAALEDILYGSSAFHFGLHQVVFTVWLRQVLGPFGHGVWAAIIGAAIWRTKGSSPARIAVWVIGAYLLSATLHGLWDWDPITGFGALFWLLAVGITGIVILRLLMHNALDQETEVVAGPDVRMAVKPRRLKGLIGR